MSNKNEIFEILPRPSIDFECDYIFIMTTLRQSTQEMFYLTLVEFTRRRNTFHYLL